VSGPLAPLENTPLRGIAEDPHGFNLRQGRVALDFREEDQIAQLRCLWESIGLEIICVLEAAGRRDV